MAENDMPAVRPGSGHTSEPAIERGEETAEGRLESALDRIAKVLEAPDPVATEVAERLDRMIASLRDALAK